MSAYTVLRTHFVSAQHLRAALLEMGFPEVELHQVPQPLAGFMGDEGRQSAEVIIRRKHIGLASSDIGFARDHNGRLQALISAADRHRYSSGWLMAVGQRYAYHVAREQLETQGFELVRETRDEDQTVRLSARRRVRA